MGYEVAGTLFFGAAQKAINVLESLHEATRAVVFDLTTVPVIDYTAPVALESAILKLQKRHILVVLAGIQLQPAALFAKAGMKAAPESWFFARRSPRAWPGRGTTSARPRRWKCQRLPDVSLRRR